MMIEKFGKISLKIISTKENNKTTDKIKLQNNFSSVLEIAPLVNGLLHFQDVFCLILYLNNRLTHK